MPVTTRRTAAKIENEKKVAATSPKNKTRRAKRTAVKRVAEPVVPMQTRRAKAAAEKAAAEAAEKAAAEKAAAEAAEKAAAEKAAEKAAAEKAAAEAAEKTKRTRRTTAKANAKEPYVPASVRAAMAKAKAKEEAAAKDEADAKVDAKTMAKADTRIIRRISAAPEPENIRRGTKRNASPAKEPMVLLSTDTSGATEALEKAYPKKTFPIDLMNPKQLREYRKELEKFVRSIYGKFTKKVDDLLFYYLEAQHEYCEVLLKLTNKPYTDLHGKLVVLTHHVSHMYQNYVPSDFIAQMGDRKYNGKEYLKYNLEVIEHYKKLSDYQEP